MKVAVIGNQDAVWGFALAGIPGKIVSTAEALMAALDAAMADPDNGIVLITEDVANLARQSIDRLIAHSATPLIIEIPGPEGPSPTRPPLSDVIRQTIGVKI